MRKVRPDCEILIHDADNSLVLQYCNACGSNRDCHQVSLCIIAEENDMADTVEDLTNPTIRDMRTGSRSVSYRDIQELIEYQRYINRRATTRRSFLKGNPTR